MINKLNGEIVINGKVVGPRFTKNNFLNSIFKDDVIRKDEYSYASYYLKAQPIGELKFAVCFFFDPLGKLVELFLRISNDEKPFTWNDWSEEHELKIREENDKWLLANLGEPPYKYEWGQVISVYDSLSATSRIIIRYS